MRDMENLKLISVRLETSTIEKIDRFSNGSRYWKRNTIINTILTEVISQLSEGDLYKMMVHRYDRDKNLQISVQIVPKPDEPTPDL